MRIDAHIHTLHADRGVDGKLCPPLRPRWVAGAQSPEAYVKECRTRGIDQVLLLDPPDVTFAVKKIFGDFILAAPQVDLDKVLPRDIDELFKRGACGIKFISPTRPYGDDAYLPIYDAVRAHQGLAVFHTGYLVLGMFEPGGLLARKSIVDINHMRPSTLDRICRAFPDLNILMAHFGNPWWEEAWKMIASHKNMYADFSGGTAYRRAMSMWSEIFKPDGRLDTAAIGKLCFASDASYCFQGVYGSEEHVAFYERFFDVLKVPAELQEQVNRGNMQRLTAQPVGRG